MVWRWKNECYGDSLAKRLVIEEKGTEPGDLPLLVMMKIARGLGKQLKLPQTEQVGRSIKSTFLKL